MKIFSDASEIPRCPYACFSDDYRGGFLLSEVYFYRAIKIGK